MEYPDCKNNVFRFDEYCKKCGASLYRTDETRSINKNQSITEFSLDANE